LIDNTRIIIAGKAADVIPIRKNIPLFYFDKFGHPTETYENKTAKQTILRKGSPSDLLMESLYLIWQTNKIPQYLT
jgi:hypothetical protein